MTTKLKSEKEWLKEYDKDQQDHLYKNLPRKLKHSTGDYVRSIQLNALEFALEIVREENGYLELLRQIEELKKK